jgi:hypothetical protein
MSTTQSKRRFTNSLFNICVNSQIHLSIASIHGKYTYVDILVQRKQDGEEGGIGRNPVISPSCYLIPGVASLGASWGVAGGDELGRPEVGSGRRRRSTGCVPVIWSDLLR